MRKYHLLLGLAFFLLLISPVKSATLNFTEYTLTEIPVSVTPNFFTYGQEIYWDTARQEWYYMYHLGTSGGGGVSYICRFDDDFSTVMDGCDAVDSGTTRYSHFIDYNSTHLKSISISGGANHLLKYISKIDLAQTTFQTNADAGFDLRLTNDDYKNNTYVFGDGVTTSEVYFSFSNGTSAELFIHSIHSRPTDLNWIYVPETDQYYLFYANYSSSLGSGCAEAHTIIYDASSDYSGLSGWQPNPIRTFQISTGCLPTNEPTGAEEYLGNANYPQGFLYAKYINGFIYWMARQRESGDSNHTLYFEAIDPVGTKNHGHLYLVKGSGEKIDLTTYDTHLYNPSNVTYPNSSQGISFEYDKNNDQWWIFYHRYNYSDKVSSTSEDYGYELMALTTASECRCSDWVNASSCGKYISGKQKQIRNCNPDMCDIEVNYTDCVEPVPTIKYKLITKCEMCNPATKLDPPQQLYAGEHGSANCQVYVDIPENVTNVTSTAYWSVYAEKELLFGLIDISPENNFTASMCNPLIRV